MRRTYRFCSSTSATGQRARDAGHDRRPRLRGAHQAPDGWLPAPDSGMLVEMSDHRLGRVEVGASGIALTALVGEWLSHTLEYVRLWGLHGAFDSVHVYMGPVGAVLVAAALAGVHSTVRLARCLERRLGELRRIQTGGPLSGLSRRLVGSPSPNSPRSTSVLGLVGIVWATQCGLYLLQENLEAGFASHGAAGLSVLRGSHALAPLVHLAVAVALVGCLWLARRRVTRLGQAVRLAEAHLRFARRPATTGWLCTPARAWTPVDRWGTKLWSRPPPAPRVA
jgi:hypothetical protein